MPGLIPYPEADVTGRTFTVAEANALLPRLQPLLEELAAKRREAAASEEDVRRATRRAGQNGGSERAGEGLQAVEAYARRAERLRQELDELGIILRDAARGLVDFPARRNGRPIFLCWQLGEPEIGWWHPVESGFAGRQPL